ncbi:MAG TPA: IPExxxVDY family protein, partial [Cyclobacteriaceae bacterium]|nr:IPExxxVDY family protein [Cyclobacteriaceae bacterium]
MKKKRLDIEYTFDFEMYGIRSTLKPYKLAWELNRCLNINLVKSPDYEVVHKSRATSNHLHYTQSKTHSLIKLLQNKPVEE